MLNYRIQITKIEDGKPVDWDFFDKAIVIWGAAWVLRSAKEVALAYAKNK